MLVEILRGVDDRSQCRDIRSVTEYGSGALMKECCFPNNVRETSILSDREHNASRSPLCRQ